jgi:uncharacterized protein (DUF488 family)
VLWTIGHSTRTLDELLGLLRLHDIERVADIRRVPASRRHPQFGGAALARGLSAAGLAYVHEPDLGGHRPPRPDSPNGYWRIAALRGYADHMSTPEFARALERLIASSATVRTALLCAEADPSRCHRQLTSDALVARGQDVRHIVGPEIAIDHALRPEARLDDAGHLTYPAPTRAARQRVLF